MELWFVQRWCWPLAV